METSISQSRQSEQGDEAGLTLEELVSELRRVRATIRILLYSSDLSITPLPERFRLHRDLPLLQLVSASLTAELARFQQSLKSAKQSVTSTEIRSQSDITSESPAQPDSAQT